MHRMPAGLPRVSPLLPSRPSTVGEKMRALLVGMKKAHLGQEEGLKTCWQTLLKMCGNVYNSPGG